MNSEMKRLARQTMEHMLDVSIPANQASRFVRIAVEAGLNGEWKRLEEEAMVREVYGLCSEKSKEALHQLGTRARGIYLPRHYQGAGYDDSIHISLPDPRSRPAGEPPYLPVFEWSFCLHVCEEYDRRHGQRSGDHGIVPLHPRSPGAKWLPISGWMVRIRKENILIIPHDRSIALAPELIPLLVELVPPGVTRCAPPPKIPIRTRFLDGHIRIAETVYVDPNDILTVTSKVRESEYIGWACAEYAHRRIYTDIPMPELFYRIALADFAQDPPSEASERVNTILLVDGSHAAPSLLNFNEILSELGPALARSARTEKPEALNAAKMLSSRGAEGLRGKVRRAGIKLLGHHLSKGLVRRPEDRVVEQFILHRFAAGNMEASYWDAVERCYISIDSSCGDAAFGQLQEIASLFKLSTREGSHE